MYLFSLLKTFCRIRCATTRNYERSLSWCDRQAAFRPENADRKQSLLPSITGTSLCSVHLSAHRITVPKVSLAVPEMCFSATVQCEVGYPRLIGHPSPDRAPSLATRFMGCYQSSAPHVLTNSWGLTVVQVLVLFPLNR